MSVITTKFSMFIKSTQILEKLVGGGGGWGLPPIQLVNFTVVYS
jgi:hypothetical protein